MSINTLCANYLQTNSNKLESTFWDLIDVEYKRLCQQACLTNQDPHEALFPLTRMRSILDMLALPFNQSWHLQQKGILLAVIGHQYSLHLIRQLNNSIQTDIGNIQAAFFTDLQVQVDQAQA